MTDRQEGSSYQNRDLQCSRLLTGRSSFPIPAVRKVSQHASRYQVPELLSRISRSLLSFFF